MGDEGVVLAFRESTSLNTQILERLWDSVPLSLSQRPAAQEALPCSLSSGYHSSASHTGLELEGGLKKGGEEGKR